MFTPCVSPLSGDDSLSGVLLCSSLNAGALVLGGDRVMRRLPDAF